MREKSARQWVTSQPLLALIRDAVNPFRKEWGREPMVELEQPAIRSSQEMVD